MKKNVIVAVVMILAILGVGIAVKYSKGDEVQVQNTNPASQIGEGEFKFTPENFQKEVLDYKESVVMVDFYLPTCPHCKTAGPIISAIAKENQGKYKIGKINAQLASELSTKYQIQSVPALLFFKNGQEVDRIEGAETKEKILQKLEEVSAK